MTEDFKVNKICCIGAGYVGGPTMAVIASNCPDIQVTVVDIDEKRISAWNDNDLKNLPIFEPGLDEIVKRCRGINLHFSIDIDNAIANSDMIFLSVNTPTKETGIGAGQASDLKWIEISARRVANNAQGKTIVVEKSTLPVKTAETIKKILDSSKNDQFSNKKEFFVLSNPEFLAEGTAINDLQNPDRVLIGGDSQSAINALEKIYLNWINKGKVIKTNLWSSELSKLTANAFLAQRISSINSISALCESTGADIKEVSKAIGMDSRIGSYFLNSGPGFGGSCFKKDILNLVYLCNHYGLDEVGNYWEKVLDINSWQQKRISKVITEKLFGNLFNKKISILGFAFKANTNDTRESPAIKICKDLLEEGAKLSIYDPQVEHNQIIKDLINVGAVTKNVDCEVNLEQSIINSDAVVILTEWEEFKKLDWAKISKIMRKPSWIFDTRNMVKNNLENFGLNYWGLGKKKSNK